MAPGGTPDLMQRKKTGSRTRGCEPRRRPAL